MLTEFDRTFTGRDANQRLKTKNRESASISLFGIHKSQRILDSPRLSYIGHNKKLTITIIHRDSIKRQTTKIKRGRRNITVAIMRSLHPINLKDVLEIRKPIA